MAGAAVSEAVLMLPVQGPGWPAAGGGARLVSGVFVAYAVWLGSLMVAMVLHECGHLLACLAAGVKVRAFRLGRPGRKALQFQVRGVTVALGIPLAGRVEHDPVASRWRMALVVLAGLLADLVVAGTLLAVGLATGPRLGGTLFLPVYQATLLAVAVTVGVIGITNLLPFRTRQGRLTEGARLLALSSPRLARLLPQEQPVLGPDGAAWRR